MGARLSSGVSRTMKRAPMEQRVDIRFMEEGEEEEVCSLARRVFDQFVAGDFPPEGVREFYSFADAIAMRERVRKGGTVLVAVEGTSVLGMLEIRDATHIAELFVEERGRGLGSHLVERARQLCLARSDGPVTMTVHSSLYAVPVYKKLGFETLKQAPIRRYASQTTTEYAFTDVRRSLTKQLARDGFGMDCPEHGKPDRNPLISSVMRFVA
jgi:GNAT superfamily N-acetyltransferase